MGDARERWRCASARSLQSAASGQGRSRRAPSVRAGVPSSSTPSACSVAGTGRYPSRSARNCRRLLAGCPSASSVAPIHDLVARLTRADYLEAQHQAVSLRWLQATDDVFRRVKPATPPRHLVAYLVPVNRTDGSVLLVDHVNADLWLPPGGHVEP